MENDTNENCVAKTSKLKNKWVYALLFLVIMLVVIIFACLGIKYAQSKIDTKKSNVETQQENKETQKGVISVELPKIEIPNIDINLKDFLAAFAKKIVTPILEEKKNPIPMYTELGQEKMNKVYSGAVDNKRVFLTFDDGPSNITPLILDVLKENNIKATFFVMGSKVVQNPEIVRRAYEEGHYIANHSYSHVYANIYESMDNLLAEYNRAEDAIRNAIGVPEYSSHLFRFPGGSIGGKYNRVKQEYTKKLAENGIMYVDWNCLNEDAMGKYTKEQLVQFVKDTSVNKNSVVVLMHDAGDKILTYETLQEVIDYFKENGYTFYNFYDIIEYELH